MLKVLINHGKERRKAKGQDVLVRLLRADLPWRAQEEAPRREREFRRILEEVLREVEGADYA